MTASNNPKLKAKLGKTNELEFLLSIKGTSSDPMAIKPEVRFHLKEEKGSFGLIFPMDRVDNEKVKVALPGDLPYFAEGKTYIGVVEVNLGNRLFAPTTVNIIFEKEPEVIALPIFEKEEPVVTEQEKIDLEEAVEAVEKKKPSLSLLDVAFPSQKEKAAPAATNNQAPKPKIERKKSATTEKDKFRETFKAKFKALLAD